MRLTSIDQTAQTRGPSHIGISDDSVTLSGFQLAVGQQQLALDGHYPLSGVGPIEAKLRASHLDAGALARLAGAKRPIPKTDIAAEIDISGSTTRPVAKLSMAGKSAAFQWQKGVRNIKIAALDIHADSQLSDGRVQASLAVKGGNIDIHAKADIPIAFNRNSPVQLDAAINKFPIEDLEPLLPPRLSHLKGRLDTHVHASGTLRAPELSASLDLPWDLGELKRNHTTLNVSYVKGLLKIDERTELAAKAAGTLALSLSLPIDAGQVIAAPRRTLTALERSTPIEAKLDLDGLDLVKVDLPYFGVVPPFSEGVIGTHVKMSGTLQNPNLTAEVTAKELARPGVVDHLGLRSRLSYQGKDAKLDAQVMLEQGKLLDVQASAEVDALAIADGAPWTGDKIHAQISVPSFDLARLRKMQEQLDTLTGTLDLQATIDGTFNQPTASLNVSIAQLHLANLVFGKVGAQASLKDRVIEAQLDTAQEGGGTIVAKGAFPLDASKALSANVHAQSLDLAFLPGLLPQLRQVKGALTADLSLRGTRAQLQPTAQVKLDNGQFSLAGDNHVYDQVTIDANIKDQRVTLAKLAVHSGDGWLKATGSAQLKGLKPESFSANAETRRFLVAFGSNAAWLDTDITLHGSNAGAMTNVRVDVKKGTVNLPKIEGGRNLQSTDPLSYVSYDDKKARTAKLTEERASTADIVAHIPGPFKIKSKEANIDLKGELDVSITGPKVQVNGTVETNYGWVDLLDRRYELERVNVAFTGAPENPALDVRLTRQFTDAAIVVEVHGTGKHPKLVLSSDPPIYDESEILGLILSGDPANTRTSDKSLDSRAVGAISGLVVGKLKDALAPKLPIDVIKIDTGGEDYAGFNQTRVEVGKYLTENVYISYVHQFGPPPGLVVTNSNEGHVEYRFKRRYELDTSYGDNGVGGIDLYWTIRY